MLLILTFLVQFAAGASEGTRRDQITLWARACADLLGAPDDFTLDFVARDAGFDLARTEHPVAGADLGFKRYLVRFANPIPHAIRVRGFGKDSVADAEYAVSKEFRGHPAADEDAWFEETERRLGFLSPHDLRVPFGDAFKDGRIDRVVVTHAADFGEDVNVVTEAHVTADVPYRVTISRFIRFEKDQLAYDADTFDVDHFGFTAPNPSFALVRTAARRFLKLSARKYQNAQLDVRRTAAGYRVIVRDLRRSARLEVLVTRLIGDRYVVNLDFDRSVLLVPRDSE